MKNHALQDRFAPLGCAATSVLAAFLLLIASTAFAQEGKPTPLLEVDLRSGAMERIDESALETDSALDAALAEALGENAANFSTRDLEEIERQIREQIGRERPRSPAQILIFVYPGRVNADRLRRLSEISVDVELVIDPCDRAVCDEAIGKHIELAGRAVGKEVHERGRYKVVFRTLIVRAVVHFREPETQEHRVPMQDCIAAAGKAGAGKKWIDARRRAAEEFEPLVARATSKAATGRRVQLMGSPTVSRQGGHAVVSLRVRASRGQAEQHVIDAMAAAMTALRENPAAPPTSEIEVELHTGDRAGPRKFRAPGHSIALWVDGEMDATTLLASYVREIKKQPDGVETMDFSADSGTEEGEEEADPSDAVAVLSANFAPLGDCARAEVERNGAFRGVTLTFQWSGAGSAQGVQPREPALRGGELAACLTRAMASIRLPRHGGSPREVTYPILVKR